MAKPGKNEVDYKARAAKMRWPELASLWNEIKEGNTPAWDNGKALEYLVIRAFHLSKLEADFPYDVPPGGKPIEQIDGAVYFGDIVFLIECKDRQAIDIDAIAKLRNQLLRRPETTFGCVFVAGHFSAAALIIANFAVPHRILLWSEGDIERAIKKRDFAAPLQNKYRQLCLYGLTDHSPNYKGLEL